MHRPRLAGFGRGTGWKLSSPSSQSGPSLLLFFLVKFQLALSVFLSQAIGVTDHGSNEIISFSVLFPSSKSFFFACCFAAWQAWRSVEDVLPSEGVRNSLKCLPAFPNAWPFLDRTTFTVRRCSRFFGLRLCDSFRPIDRRKISDIDASIGLCTATPRPHTSIPYTLYARIHILKESCLAWPRGR